jgi:hypothetical protein
VGQDQASAMTRFAMTRCVTAHAEQYDVCGIVVVGSAVEMVKLHPARSVIPFAAISADAISGDDEPTKPTAEPRAVAFIRAAINPPPVMSAAILLRRFPFVPRRLTAAGGSCGFDGLRIAWSSLQRCADLRGVFGRLGSGWAISASHTFSRAVFPLLRGPVAELSSADRADENGFRHSVGTD